MGGRRTTQPKVEFETRPMEAFRAKRAPSFIGVLNYWRRIGGDSQPIGPASRQACKNREAWR
eukprot:3888551-Pyramimonas_sp.AAC.1